MPHTIYAQIWIESPEDPGEDNITAGPLETAIKLALMRSGQICRAIEIDKIEVEADMDARLIGSDN